MVFLRMIYFVGTIFRPTWEFNLEISDLKALIWELWLLRIVAHKIFVEFNENDLPVFR